MNGDEPVPYFESIVGVSVCRLIPNHIDVGLANGWQKAIEGEFDARTGTQEAGKGFCSPLGVSFDGMALWRPWKLNPAWKTNRGGSWLHIDQHPITRPGFHCVQSLVARFAALHGGRAWVENTDAGGAAFRVFLPACVVASEDPASVD